MSYYYENQCVRALEGDPRLAELYKKYYTLGFRYEVEYGPGAPTAYNLEWEKNQVTRKDYHTSGRCAGDTVIVEEKEMR